MSLIKYSLIWAIVFLAGCLLSAACYSFTTLQIPTLNIFSWAEGARLVLFIWVPVSFIFTAGILAYQEK